jgi:hypothetical protein
LSCFHSDYYSITAVQLARHQKNLNCSTGRDSRYTIDLQWGRLVRMHTVLLNFDHLQPLFLPPHDNALFLLFYSPV